MRLTYLCGRESTYIRNDLMLKALRRVADVTLIASQRRYGGLRFAEVIAKSWYRRNALRHSRLQWIGFWGHPLVPLYAAWTHQPIVFDAYLSVYNTVCEDRQWFASQSWPGRIALWMDQVACQQATLVLLDTQAHADYFHHTLGVPTNKLRVVYVGCDESLFSPRPSVRHAERVRVFTYSSFQPLHGVSTIIEAATHITEPTTQFMIGGTGQTFQHALAQANQSNNRTLTFCGWIPFGDLPSRIADSDICLAGPFGSSTKAQMVVPTKTFQFMAMGKAIIATDTPANREVLEHGKTAYLVPVNDPDRLAAAIRELQYQADLRMRLAENARQHFEAHFTLSALSCRLQNVLGEFDAPVHRESRL